MAVPLFNLTHDLTVSRLCLGTMTFGEQNSLSQSFQLLYKAFISGINFFDSAEMYPVPQRAETQGRSEEYLGRWIRNQKIPRDGVVLATKISEPSGQMTLIRGGPGSVDDWNITEAIDGSLTRLKTDYIDCIKFIGLIAMCQCLEKLSMTPSEDFLLLVLRNNLLLYKKLLLLLRYVGLSNETPYMVS